MGRDELMLPQTIVPVIECDCVDGVLVAKLGGASEPIEQVGYYGIAGDVLVKTECTLEQCEGLLRQMSCRILGPQVLLTCIITTSPAASSSLAPPAATA